MSFNIGDIISSDQLSEAAAFCNTKYLWYIAEAESASDGSRRWKIALYVPSKDNLLEQLRLQRNAKLAATDYAMLPDYVLPSNLLKKVKEYRQQLRDLPEQDGSPWDGGGEATPWPINPLTNEV